MKHRAVPTPVTSIKSPHRSAFMSKLVTCFAPRDQLPTLTRSVPQRYYTAAYATLQQGPVDQPMAAIVSDAVADPIGICHRLAEKCPCILVTSDMSLDFRRLAAAAGVRAIVQWPHNLPEIADWLMQFEAQQQDDQLNVVIVDDDELSTQIYEAAFAGVGIRTTIINNSIDALHQIESLRPDLILLDLEMPQLDGLELLKLIRQCREFISVPIVFLSAEGCPDRQLELRSFGADDFLMKPVNIERLIDMVRLRTSRFILLRAMIETDGLTGLLTHNRLKDRLAFELERTRRTDSHLTFAMLDIDRFKSINDTYGHPSGDIIIRRLSQMLLDDVRKIDIIGRYGGEEFGIILLDTGIDGAKKVLEKLRRNFARQVFDLDGERVRVTFSAGAANSRQAPCLESIIRAADSALYRAKNLGRNRTEVVSAASFDPEAFAI